MKIELINNVRHIKQGDTETELEFVLINNDDEPVNITGANVEFLFSNEMGLILVKEAEIIDATKGEIKFSFNEGEVTGSGGLLLEVKVVFSDEDVQYFPSQGYYSFDVEPNLEMVQSGVYPLITIAYKDMLKLNEESRIATAETIIQSAYAKTQGDYANEKGLAAEQKGTFAQTQGEFAKAQAESVGNAAGQASLATTRANNAADLANEKAELANFQAAHAKVQGDAALLQANNASVQANRAKEETEGLALIKKGLTDATEAADDARKAAELSSQNANNSVEAANAATYEAAKQGVFAKEQGDHAKTQGDYAKVKADEVAGKGAYAQTQGDYAKSVGDANKNIYKSPVANFAAIASTYPNPALGWKVQTTNDGKFYRYDGSSWVFTEEMNNAALADIQAQLGSTNRQTATLTQPVNVLTTSQATSFDPVVKGNTLANLALNPATEDGKNYVATFPNRNVGLNLNGTYTYANTKFQNTRTVAPVLMADFVGKVQGSTVENPHIAKRGSTGHNVTTLMSPSLFNSTFPTTECDPTRINSLNGSYESNGSSSVAGGVAQHLFSFNLIEHIERTYGAIPKTTVADKTVWLRANIQKLTLNWHGFGTSPLGNKAYVAMRRMGANDWHVYSVSNLSQVALVKTTESSYVSDRIDNDGFVHFLAYADPATGNAADPNGGASTINTDYVNLEVELKQIAPTTTVKDDFTGKVSGSVVENPHIAKPNITGNETVLLTPSQFTVEVSTSRYNAISSLNATSNNQNTLLVNGAIAQNLFSFNLLEIVKRKYGFTPPNVQWLKDNIVKITANWHGFGSSVGGNNATLARWSVGGSNWAINGTHSNSSVQKITGVPSTASDAIDTNGFYHTIAYASASDGTTPSAINTDFIELEVEIKNPFALRIRPTKQIAGLYEVDTTTYNKVNVDPEFTGDKLLNKFPAVVGVQHVQNPAITAQGKNLLPPFTEWTLHPNATVKSSYDLELNANAAFQVSTVTISLLPNTTYTMTSNVSLSGGYHQISFLDSNGVDIGGTVYSSTSGVGVKQNTFTTSANVRYAKIIFQNYTGSTGLFNFTNPQLELGNTATPFEPKNEDVLYAKATLAGNTSAKDELYKRDGQWYKSKRWETVSMTEISPSFNFDSNGYKAFRLNSFAGMLSMTNNTNHSIMTKHDGKILKPVLYSARSDGSDQFTTDGTTLIIGVPDSDTGFADSYTPAADEIKAYFNGWQVKTADGSNKPTAWRSIVDGTDAPTQTLAYVKTNLAPNYTPYHLTYQLATTKEEAVQVEGAISLHEGANQIAIDSGVVVRERVTPTLYGSAGYYINRQVVPASLLKNKVSKVIAIYKNGSKEPFGDGTNGWLLGTSDAYGNERYHRSSIDPTALYEVTYTVLDKHLYTANVTEVSGTYETSLKTNLSGLTERVGDVTTQVSINTQQIINILVRLKAGGL